MKRGPPSHLISHEVHQTDGIFKAKESSVIRSIIRLIVHQLNNSMNIWMPSPGPYPFEQVPEG